MIQTSKPHVSLTYLLNFKDLDSRVRLQQAQAEDAFGELVNVQSQQTNLPDDFDPGHARIQFSSEKKSIAISQVACQFSLNFLDAALPFAKEIEISRKNIALFSRKAIEFKPVSEYHVQSLILELRYPSTSSSLELAKFIHERFVKAPSIGDAASAVLQLGYRQDDLYLNLTVNPYESRKIPISSNINFFRADSLEILEQGIQIRIEVNNIPSVASSEYAVVADQLMTSVEKFMSDHFEAVFGLKLS